MKNKLLVALVAAAMVSALALAGCSNGSSSAEDTASDAAATATDTAAAATDTAAAAADTAAAAAPGEAAGFTEYPIFEDQQVGEFINLSCVYFQPVPMSPGQEDISGYNMHLEADISALANDLGYGVGDWIPYLTVDYAITGSDGSTAASGTFMEMSASDGPHYGANVALAKADTYNLTITIHSPAENGYLIHSDAATGPGGTLDKYFANGNLSYTFEGWDYTPREW